MNTAVCDKCGQEIHISDYPFCPHDPAGPHGVIDDTLPGGARYLWNLGDKPVWCESKTDYRRLLAERGLVQDERRQYNRNDKSPWASPTRLRPGQIDPFLPKS